MSIESVIKVVLVAVLTVGSTWIAYEVFNYVGKLKNIFNKFIFEVKEVRNIGNDFDNKIQKIYRLLESADETMKFLLQKQDFILETEKELINREDFCDRSEMEFEEKNPNMKQICRTPKMLIKN